MLRLFLIFFMMILFLGCSFSSNNVSVDLSLQRKLDLQKKQSDEEVLKLEKEIQKLEADKIKYKKEYERFDNNPILDELDETLKKDDNQDDNQTKSIND